MAALTDRELGRIAWRASLLQATWNYERQQGLGWAFALKPALERLVPDGDLPLRLAEHTAYFNTQPTLASVALGAVARMEEARAQAAETAADASERAGDWEGPKGAGEWDGDAIARVKSVLGSSLAALGDRVFWFTLRPFSACLGMALAVLGFPWAAVAQWLVYNALHQGVRFWGVRLGYRDGPAAAGGVLRRRLEFLATALARGGALLVGFLVAAIMVPDGYPRPVGQQLLLVGGLALGLVAAQRPRPSPTEWALGAGAIMLTMAWLR